MNKGYEVAQGALSWVAFLAFGVAFPFTLESWGVLNALSFDQYVAETALVAGGVFAAVVAVKLAMSWRENKFFIKMNLADWLYKMSVRIDPRRG